MAKNKKRRGGKPQGKDKDFKRNQNKEEVYVDKSEGKPEKYDFKNHPSDFIPDESIRKQVGSFSFNNTIGMPITYKTTINGTSTATDQNVPSVMSISTFSSIGSLDASSYIDGVNTSGHKWYNILSSINAKTTNYQPEDLSLVIVCVSSLIELVANAERVYGVCFNFNPRNRTIPDALIAAMGVRPNSLTYDGDVSAFRMRLNRILTKANGIRILDNIRLFKRCWEMNSRIFIDNDSSMGQYYVFRPHGYWLLTEGATTQRAVWQDFGDDLISAGELLDAIDSVVSTLLQSTLFNYIYTDMLNYVDKKGGSFYGFGYVPELLQVFGVYDPGILNQIHNMTWGGFDLSDYKIIDSVQNNRIYTTNPLIYTAPVPVAWEGSLLLDHVYTDQPTYDDNVDALAFKSIAYNSTLESGKWSAAGIYLPDHPVYDIKIYIAGNAEPTVLATNYLTTQTNTITVFTTLKLLSAFKVAPLIYYLDYQSGNKIGALGSLNFYTLVEPEQLENIFNYYYLGLYDVEVKDVKEFQ